MQGSCIRQKKRHLTPWGQVPSVAHTLAPHTYTSPTVVVKVVVSARCRGRGHAQCLGMYIVPRLYSSLYDVATCLNWHGQVMRRPPAVCPEVLCDAWGTTRATAASASHDEFVWCSRTR